MQIVISKNNVPIRITDERINHISRNHPEMLKETNRIIDTLKNPEIILEGDFGELLATKLFYSTPVTTDKYLVVAYKEVNSDDGFVITAYYTRRLSKRRNIV